jgi:hypothetical protein
MTTTTIRRDRLHALATAELIGQYDAAISSYKGRCTNFSPRQKRIDFIVNLLSARADNDDAAALAWFATT